MSPLTVAYAGHLYPWKGVDVLLEAIARVPAVQGLVIGGQEKETDLARLRALATPPGHREPSDVRRPSAPVGSRRPAGPGCVLALPNPASAISTHSTSPLKLFEYMAAGKAIVASSLPAIREVLTDEITAPSSRPAIGKRSLRASGAWHATPRFAAGSAPGAECCAETVGTGAPNGSRRSSPT